MIVKALPPHEFLVECFDYDKATGALLWRSRPAHHFPTQSFANGWNKRFAGKAAGCVTLNGYMSTDIFGRPQLNHRLIWKLTIGSDPTALDHKNGIRSDNRWDNLREASVNQNAYNTGKNLSNTSGFKGVWFRRSMNTYIARIRVNGKRLYLGAFRTAGEAHAAYCTAAAHFHGAFAHF